MTRHSQAQEAHVVLQAGRHAVVRVSVATLWQRPESVRPLDRPALAAQTDLRSWIAAMDRAQQVDECVLSQLLLGERVLIEQTRTDGWVRVVALEQPAPKLDPRGYPGWLPAEQLAAAPGADGDGQPLVVDAAVIDLRDAPDGAVLLPGVILGTRLAAAGPAVHGWQPLRVPGHDRPLWAQESALAQIPSAPPAAAEVLAVAQRLRDVVYIWGGVSTYGIDCSGLVRLAWRRFGVQLPRDADDQADATTPVPMGDERPGDLYFFARPGAGIHHIGIVSAAASDSDERRMLHACYINRRVLEEPLPAERTATLVGVHRV